MCSLNKIYIIYTEYNGSLFETESNYRRLLI